ncbi:hypothetical protein, partial [Rugamonas violacea]|uniref:hypothetical protein n=1 Tax=Rugamonas sp. CCM 8940 TaxID=2765359 RepID=UPI001F4264FA
FEPLTKRFVCQLRRRKSMQRFGHFVNLLFLPAYSAIACFCVHFCGEANYSKAINALQGPIIQSA